MCTVLTDTCTRLAQKIKFIGLVVSGAFAFAGKRKQQLVDEFTKHNFVPGANEYLLNMPMWNLTQDKKDALDSELEEKTAQLTLLQNTSPENLWRQDLAALKQKLQLCSKRKR